MTNTERVYVNTTDGNWYYYNGKSWVPGGKYQSSIEPNNVKILGINDYDIIKNIIDLSRYNIDLISKNLIKPFEYSEKNGATVRSKGISRISTTGSKATSETILVYGEPIHLEGGKTYTYAIFDIEDNPDNHTYSSCYFVKEKTNTAYRIDGNIVEIYALSSYVTFKTFTPPETISVEPCVYFGGPDYEAKKGTFRIFLVEGEYTQDDFVVRKDNLKDFFEGRVFKGTCSKNSKIPKWNIPVFYLAKGPGPFSNFGLDDVNPSECSYNIFLNDTSNGTWVSYSLPLMTNDTLVRDSISSFVPTSQHPDMPTSQKRWAICATEGTYTNFLNYNQEPQTLNKGEVAIFQHNSGEGVQWWDKRTIEGLTTKAYVDESINDALSPVTQNIEQYVTNWLDEHPEATTTVEDGSISAQKLEKTLSDKMSRFRADYKFSDTWELNKNDLNIIVGDGNMPNGIGSKNMILGIESLQANNQEHSANSEIAIGYHSLFRDWDGHLNTSIGHEAMDNVSHGEYNVAIGPSALRCQRVANYDGNSIEGETANNNTCVGHDTMLYAYGSNNTILGAEALRGTGYGSTGSNNIAIGYCAGKWNTDENDHLYIDNQDRKNRSGEINKSLIYGTFAEDIANQFVKINGMFACNGVTPQAPLVAKNDATDLQTAIELLNQIKDALQKAGIMK